MIMIFAMLLHLLYESILLLVTGAWMQATYRPSQARLYSKRFQQSTLLENKFNQKSLFSYSYASCYTQEAAF